MKIVTIHAIVSLLLLLLRLCAQNKYSNHIIETKIVNQYQNKKITLKKKSFLFIISNFKTEYKRTISIYYYSVLLFVLFYFQKVIIIIINNK